MLYLESFVHRVPIAEIVSRWIINRPKPEDVMRLKEIISFNSYISRIWVDRLARELLVAFHGFEPKRRWIHNKGELKDLIATYPHYHNPRIDDMITRYRRFPEDFYRETPIDGRVYYGGTEELPRFVGATRIKRYRRIAEKGSRRIVDFMFSQIKRNADALAEERARSLGVPRHQLMTPHDQMVEEFAHAERRLVKSIKQGTILSEFPILSIPDAVGVKLIAANEEYDRLLGVIRANPACRLLETEQHSGTYTAVNLRVAYMIPKAALLASPPTGPHLAVLKYRGFDPAQVPELYAKFIESAEDHVILEVIVSDFQNFLESEIGRSIHEERVFSQRAHRVYNSHLAINVQYLMNYILSLCRAPEPKVLDDIPIKLWVKYLPDTIEQLLALQHISEDWYFDALAHVSA